MFGLRLIEMDIVIKVNLLFNKCRLFCFSFANFARFYQIKKRQFKKDAFYD
jgi:hypothetical protein